VHPGVRDGIERFDVDRLRELISSFTFLGEIGLDRKADTPAARHVLEQLVEILVELPLIASVHSTGRTGPVVDILAPALQRTILHWFTGTSQQIERAVAGGAYFSINTAMTDEQITQLPPDRVLPETDYPFTRRAGSARPGDIARLEERLSQLWSKTHEDIRRGWYRNLRALCLQANVLDRLPEAIVAPVVSA
jgi:TatD DNase family protein